jgi:hypothetical protein
MSNNLNLIEAVKHKSKFATGYCSWISIDGNPIEYWFNEKIEEETLGLALAQIWLINEDEDKLAWERINQLEDGTTTIVPVLVCSDDMDFACNVVVVEQTIKDGIVEWARAGQSISTDMQVGATVQWYSINGEYLARFKLDDFEFALVKFKELMKDNS